VKLAESADRCFFGAFQGEQLVGIIRLSRYSARNEKHRAYLGGLYMGLRQDTCKILQCKPKSPASRWFQHFSIFVISAPKANEGMGI